VFDIATFKAAFAELGHAFYNNRPDALKKPLSFYQQTLMREILETCTN